MVELMSFVKLVIPTSEEVTPPLSKYTSQPSLNMTLEEKQLKVVLAKGYRYCSYTFNIFWFCNYLPLQWSGGLN
jgi:hypothetical protein